MDNTKYALNKPTALIASREDIDFLKHCRLFRRQGIECVIVKDKLQLIEEALKPGCFTVFVDDTFDPDVLLIMNRMKSHSKAYWIYCLRGEFGRQSSQKAISSGASLLLFRPSEPDQYLLRARQMLARFEGRQIPLDSKEKTSGRIAFQATVDEKKAEVKRAKSLEDAKASAPKAPIVVAPAPKMPLIVPQQVIELPKFRVVSKGKIFEEDFKTIEVKQSYKERRPQWAKHSEAIHPRSFLGLEHLKKKHAEVLQKILATAGHGKLSLCSVKVDSPLQRSADRVRILVENKFTTKFPDSEKIENYPDLARSIETLKPVFVMNTSTAASYAGPLRRDSDMSVASLPILSRSKQLSGVLRASFPVQADLNLEHFLEDLASFAPEFHEGFASLEFFSRVYSADCPLYDRKTPRKDRALARGAFAEH